MEQLKNKKWWLASLTRALKTFAQTFVATVGTSMVISEVNFNLVLSASCLSALLSFMTSLGGLPEVE